MARTLEADAERQRRKSQESRIVVVPPCHDPDRRARLEASTVDWLRWYYHDDFTFPFSSAQLDMIRILDHAFLYGGDQGLAAPRGEGKSTFAQRVGLKAVLSGALPFLLIFAATGADAENALDEMKRALEENERLADDYPEVCVPIHALAGAPQRARTQLVTGSRHDNGEAYVKHGSRFVWSGREVILPRIPGSPASEAIIATRGLDAAVRGVKIQGRRPTVAIIDDPDTEETAVSEDQTAKLEKKIERAIAGLGGQRRTVARVLLSTLQNHVCVSARFTDPKVKPAFKGRRYRFLVDKPERIDLWEEYVALWQQDMQDGDPFARRANALYQTNREAMDAGAVVANPFRFDARIVPDGTQLESSALQHYYNFAARNGFEAAACELDSDPPAERAIVEHGITAHRVQWQVNGLSRKLVPPSAVLITQGIDCRKVALHWVVRAWDADGTGWTIDYGVTEVRGVVYGSEEGLDLALHRAILERHEQAKDDPYRRGDGTSVPLETTLVDAGWRTKTVYEACRAIGPGILPAMGCGKSAGCAQASFREAQSSTPVRQPGDGWFITLRDGGLWLVMMDSDRWKSYEHDRWMTDPGRPGAMTLFGDKSDNPNRMSNDQRGHHSYARHILAETEVEEFAKGVLVRKWKSKTDNNHWLDASYMSHVAASMRGIRLHRGGVLAAMPAPAPRPSDVESFVPVPQW